ncbi:hypothetical protein IKF89_01750 [Candidatus Saccharibacteria bacterium]|nr:hypothetical protein [Candidatus Saccharibacteria bacterium]
MALRQSYITSDFWGEGDRDWSWIKYLYGLYHVEAIRVRADNARGGSPTKQIQDMIDVAKRKFYDRRTAMFDTDRGEEEVNEALELAKNNGIYCILSEKNIECEILKLRGVSARRLSRAMTGAHAAKKEFQIEFNLESENDDVEWSRYFPKSFLDAARSTNHWLDEIISRIERL